MIAGSIWLLMIILEDCIFLSFSTKIQTFWSISKRNRKFVQICVSDHILSAKVVFWYIKSCVPIRKKTQLWYSKYRKWLPIYEPHKWKMTSKVNYDRQLIDYHQIPAYNLPSIIRENTSKMNRGWRSIIKENISIG